MKKDKVQTLSIDKDTFNNIKKMYKGKKLDAIKTFKELDQDDYIFCRYPNGYVKTRLKQFGFGLYYIFQYNKKKSVVNPVAVFGFNVPINDCMYMDIDIGHLNLKDCKFNLISEKCYNNIKRIVVVNAIANQVAGKKNE